MFSLKWAGLWVLKLVSLLVFLYSWGWLSVY